ncbi:LXG domain-containing protein [Listeria innocua]|uniref:LXG domain-containing protein n=1 Tax=Listeria innocua TaxID=1642 RepID=UPI002158E96C|nr:LXG domain-containing protein [Listeria innocua]UVD69754.1 LXG domain-containing protein [Listeria innocua]
MKIDVRELNEIVSENIVMLKKEYENLNIAMNATTNFTVETQEFFKGKTADASRAYLQEAYKPVQQKR